MGLFATTLRALLPLFGLILLGYLMKRLKVLGPAHVPLMNGLVINATLPALVIYKLATAPAITRQMALLPALLIVSEVAVIGLALALGRIFRLRRPTTAALMLVGAFGNTGFLGYPIALALLPGQFTSAVLIDQIGMGPPLYVLAPLLGAWWGNRPGGAGTTRSGVGESVLRALRSPILVGLAIGLLARVVPHPPSLLAQPAIADVGDVVAHILIYLGQGTTPLVLLALGIALRPSTVRTARLPVTLAVALKLVAAPLAMLALGHAFRLQGDVATIAVLQAAMPAAVMASVLSETSDLDGDFAVAAVCVTTVLSALTLPFWMTIAR